MTHESPFIIDGYTLFVELKSLVVGFRFSTRKMLLRTLILYVLVVGESLATYGYNEER